MNEAAVDEKYGHWVAHLRALLDRSRFSHDVIDLSIGQPDGPPPQAVLDMMGNPPPDIHRYPDQLGSDRLRALIADWVTDRLGVPAQADEVALFHGAKIAVALSIHAFTQPGDVVVCPTPGYPTYGSVSRTAGREVRWLRLRPEEGFLPTRKALESAFAGASLAFLNYPNNPTGAVATADFFAHAIEIAHSTGTVLIHDGAYVELAHAGDPLCIHQLPGSEKVAIELHSFSKALHLAGWRVGFALGRDPLLGRLTRTLQRYDTGASRIAQEAVLRALTSEPAFAEGRHQRDQERTAHMARGLRSLGARLVAPRAAFYLWFRPPAGHDGDDAWATIVEQAGIACAPGSHFGPEGEGWIRFCCVRPVEVLDQALERLKTLWTK